MRDRGWRDRRGDRMSSRAVREAEAHRTVEQIKKGGKIHFIAFKRKNNSGRIRQTDERTFL